MDPCQDLTDEDILTAIKNSNGTRDALFVPEVSFINIISIVMLYLTHLSLANISP